MNVEERFWAKVNIGGPDECWEWTAFRNPAGYGRFGIGYETALTHRFSYALTAGVNVTDLGQSVVMHSCDNPPCCNPKHLSLATQAQNLADMVDKGRRARLPSEWDDDTCKRGHRDDIYISPTDGHRRCAACKRDSDRKSYQRRLAAAV